MIEQPDNEKPRNIMTNEPEYYRPEVREVVVSPDHDDFHPALYTTAIRRLLNEYQEITASSQIPDIPRAIALLAEMQMRVEGALTYWRQEKDRERG